MLISWATKESSLLLIQEKDPSIGAAFAAAQSLHEQEAQSMTGNSSSAMAVDGFIPKFKPKKPAPKPSRPTGTASKTGTSASERTAGRPASERTAGVTAPLGMSSSPISSSNVAQPQPSQSTPEARHAAPAEATSSSSGAVQQAQPSTLTGTDQSAPQTGPVGAALHQLPSGAVNQAAMATTCSTRLHTVDPDAAFPSSSASISDIQVIRQGEHEPEGVTDTRPVISFEMLDADSPLEGSEHGINAKFGRLKVLRLGSVCGCVMQLHGHGLMPNDLITATQQQSVVACLHGLKQLA